jgi:hypothetical protein
MKIAEQSTLAKPAAACSSGSPGGFSQRVSNSAAGEPLLDSRPEGPPGEHLARPNATINIAATKSAAR